ncbi:MAG: hypothetical protein K6T78_06520 [Alicyclobacillus sp.]|nr:hypothetical protein [Alicyclobacillus sp.]
MDRFLFISDHSRKAKAVRQTYEYLRHHVDASQWVEKVSWDGLQGHDGIPVPKADRKRILALKVHDEHLSPYIRTDLNLFQMHMLDEHIAMTVYRAGNGWLIVYNNVSDGPRPFGSQGYDTR